MRILLLVFPLALTVLACGPLASDGNVRDQSHGESAASAASAATSGAAASELVLMTLNAEFLWDGIQPEDGEISFSRKGSPEKASAHMAAIAKIIRASDPDIVQLVEVENLPALRQLERDHLADLGYRAYLVEGTDTATGQDVGILSRYEIDSMGRDPRKGRSGKTRKSVSKNYVAKLQVGDLRLGLVGLHFLAKPSQRSRVERREAQADAVRGMARELAGQGRSVIVWGDFNDFDGQTLDRDGSQPITQVLKWIRDMDPRDPDDDLINVSQHVDKRKRFTSASGDAIDHILVSPDLAQRISNVEIRHDIPRNVTRHYPIIVTLKL